MNCLLAGSVHCDTEALSNLLSHSLCCSSSVAACHHDKRLRRFICLTELRWLSADSMITGVDSGQQARRGAQYVQSRE